MNLDNLQNILKDEPKYRESQIKQAVFRDLIENWDSATVLPLALREKLTKECSLEIKAEIFKSKNDPTKKAVITLDDGVKIETALMSYGNKKEEKNDRNTACVSCQAGCPLDCAFCATGRNGFKRNLSANEIIEQVIFWDRILKKEGDRVSNVVFMGMGEPFLNYDEVIKAIRILTDQKGISIGSRKISISTIGIPEKIERFANEDLQVNLAISIHAPNDELRGELAPINFKHNLKSVMRSADNYLAKTKRKIMFEYMMIDGLNDSEFFARELIQLIRINIKKERQYLCMINLIAHNKIGKFSPSTKEKIGKFKKILENSGMQTTERFRFGQDINAGCGQLATSRFKKYE
jgi:23S rRNA (adenine2503-C2)-methyltransferase